VRYGHHRRHDACMRAAETRDSTHDSPIDGSEESKSYKAQR
jgi:hypothetical protein